MKKLAMLISLIITGNVVAETVNHQMVIRIPKMDTIKADEMGSWELNRYEYSNIKAPILKSVGDFIPNITDQETSFTQTKEQIFTVNKDRTEILVNSKTLSEKQGSTININEDFNEDISRIIVPQVGNWINIGTLNCGGWTPSTISYLEGVQFTQTRQCDQNQEKTINYFSNSVQVDTKTITRVNTTQESQQAIGTKIPEDLSPASAGQKITLLNSSYTEWANQAITNGRMFDGLYMGVYSAQSCISLNGQNHWVDFTVQEPLMINIIGNTEYPEYSRNVGVAVVEKGYPNAVLGSTTLTSNGSAKRINYMLQPGKIYQLRTSGGLVFCEIGAAQ